MSVRIRHLQPYYAWHVLQVVLHFIDEQSSRHQFHQCLHLMLADHDFLFPNYPLHETLFIHIPYVEVFD